MTPPLRAARRHPLAVAAPLLAGLLSVRSALADYEPNAYVEPGTNLRLEYNLYVPNGYEPGGSTKYPLMVFLHAANNTNPPNRTLSSDGQGWVEAGGWVEPENQQKYPSFFLIPISQTNSSGWGDPTSQGAEQKFEGRLTVVVVQELLTRYRIDADRLYITGPSMGGRGTWDIIRRNPALFAAAAPCAAPASAADAALYAGQNIWSINGENDSTVEANRSAVDAIRAACGNPIYSEYANHGHDTWREIYPMPEFLEWMYAQRRGVPWATVSTAPTLPGLTGPSVVPPPAGCALPGSGGTPGAAGAGAGMSGAGVSGASGASGTTVQGGVGGSPAVAGSSGDSGATSGGQSGVSGGGQGGAASTSGGNSAGGVLGSGGALATGGGAGTRGGEAASSGAPSMLPSSPAGSSGSDGHQQAVQSPDLNAGCQVGSAAARGAPVQAAWLLFLLAAIGARRRALHGT